MIKKKHIVLIAKSMLVQVAPRKRGTAQTSSTCLCFITDVGACIYTMSEYKRVLPSFTDKPEPLSFAFCHSLIPFVVSLEISPL